MHSIRIAIAIMLVLAGGCSGDNDDPKEPSASCCNPAEQPGTNGNPLCFEGATCCADGTWACNEGDGSETCAAPVCTAETTACCDPAMMPGTNGIPFCIEGASCCADGTWACNEGDGSPTCAVCE
jgi:hypothetical protein